MSEKILVIYAHATAHKSRVNRRLAQAARTVPGVRVHDLYETYPDFHIDVGAEQALLAEADVLVFLHPVQWYSMPALLKEWVDCVLQAGWAYGKGGAALAGKAYWLVVTCGSSEEDYDAAGAHGRAFDAYLPPFRQTAALCKMHWEAPLILYGAHKIDNPAVDAHVEAFRQRLAALAQPDLQPDLD
ncbi:MAG TPA: NAD(P)H-dependent oxidoreductase [Telluria sp.]